MRNGEIAREYLGMLSQSDDDEEGLEFEDAFYLNKNNIAEMHASELAAAATTLHVFNPDHNLVCTDCDEGELAGNHGITAVCDGHNHYASAEAAAMYEEGAAFETTGNEFYAPARR
jgi:hypothetical protein